VNSFGICLNKPLQNNILILCNILKQLDFPTLIIYITLYNYIVQLKNTINMLYRIRASLLGGKNGLLQYICVHNVELIVHAYM